MKALFDDHRRVIKIFWTTFLTMFLGFILMILLISTGNLGFMPSFKDLENPKSNVAAEVFSEDNALLGKYFKQNRTIVNFDELSPYLVNALLATEDVRFYEHSGVDDRSLWRVVYGMLTLHPKGGGSTITQQLAKNLFPRDTLKNKFFLFRALHLANTKFREWVTAVKLERNYTKRELMCMYFNTVTFGSETYGIKAAARVFFNTTPKDLKVEQAAVLVGLLKAPSYYSPVISQKSRARCIRRRNVVLTQMEKYNFIREGELDSLKKLKLSVRYTPQSQNEGIATYFREFLRTMLTAHKPERSNYPSYATQTFKEDSIEWENNPAYGWCNKNKKADGSYYNLYSDGIRIFTTVNSKMQQYAEEAVEEHVGKTLQPAFSKEKRNAKNGPFSWDMKPDQIKHIYELSVRRSDRYMTMKRNGYSEEEIKKVFNTPVDMKVFSWHGDVDTTMTPLDSIKYYKYYLNAGFMSMEPQTGKVKAYVGGINYKYFKYDHVKLARRQVGSTFKPFLYTLAMMDYAPCYKVPNNSVSFEMPKGSVPAVYTPAYSDNKHPGEMVSFKFGLANSLNQISAWIMKRYGPQAVVDIAHKMGVRTPLDPVLSLCVGSAEVYLDEMVAAYSSFANKGIYTEPIFITKIEDKNGNVIAKFSAKQRHAIDERTAYRMVTLMRGVVDYGTSVRLRYKYDLKNPIAGKTGTTNKNSDAWFIGYVPKLISGAWIGGEERSIHFTGMTMGQGAAAALPIWALFMKKVYADKSINLNASDDFEVPDGYDADDLKCNDFGGEPAGASSSKEDDELFR